MNAAIRARDHFTVLAAILALDLVVAFTASIWFSDQAAMGFAGGLALSLALDAGERLQRRANRKAVRQWP